MSRSLFSLLIILLLLSCGRHTAENGNAVKPGQKDMEAMNRFLVEKDRERIINYMERKGLSMTETPSGLWYQITKAGEGPNLRENDKITFEYECSLLDGTLCYSSKIDGPKEIIPARSNIEAGLYEGLRLLKPGSEAIFVMPPFLAYGLRGDGKKIPPRSVIVYKVNILRVE